MLRVARFLRGYVRHPLPGVVAEEVELDRDQGPIPASYIRPAKFRALPGWIVLHGITVPGRQHVLLQRFAHSLAASGAAVVIPEVDEWKRLRIDRGAGDRAILAAARFLEARPEVIGPYNLVGFSFGATQALTSSMEPGIRDHVGSVVGFGGYCDLRSTLRFMMTGEHEWLGVKRELAPDPYGRWIALANYLPHVPELAHMAGLADAAAELAAESGRQGLYAGDPSYDRLKAEFRASLSPEEQELWDLIAPPSGVTPPADAGRELADLLVEAALRVDPRADPAERLATIDKRVVLAHGHEDQLIPFTESLRLHAALPPQADVSVSITRLFAHSREADRLGFLHYPREITRYLNLLNRALTPC